MIPSSLLGLDGGPPEEEGNPLPLAPSELSTPGPTRHVEVMGLGIHTFEAPAPTPDAPAVVLIHGLNSRMGLWQAQVDRLTRAGLRVVALDLPGFGASDKPDAPYTPTWYADMVAGWMDLIDTPRAAVMGHSMGGQIALWLALRHPQRVERLSLVSPAGIEVFSEEAADWMRDFWHETRALEASDAELRANFTQLAFYRNSERVEALLQERIRLKRHPDYRAISRTASRCIAGLLNEPVSPYFAALENRPVQVVFGAEDRMVPNPKFTGGTTQDIADRARDVLPRAQVSVLPEAGHFPHIDAPDAFHAVVDPFLCGASDI